MRPKLTMDYLKSKTLSVKLTPSQYRALSDMAIEDYIPLSALVRKHIANLIRERQSQEIPSAGNDANR